MEFNEWIKVEDDTKQLIEYPYPKSTNTTVIRDTGRWMKEDVKIELYGKDTVREYINDCSNFTIKNGAYRSSRVCLDVDAVAFNSYGGNRMVRLGSVIGYFGAFGDGPREFALLVHKGLVDRHTLRGQGDGMSCRAGRRTGGFLSGAAAGEA